MHHDHRYMKRALQLAALGLGRTSPNPPVGAVVVRDDIVVGEGYHRRAGEPHAEAAALAAAGEAARNGDLYCTLEPCCHFGRTGPCTDAIIAAGVRRVVYAAEDPDIRCAGEGAQKLRQAGIRVELGVLQAAVHELYEPYFQHKTSGRPFVTLKLASTLDGRLAAADGSSRWITGEAARRLVHQWRDETDAVMVGVGTLLADDPEMTARLDKHDEREPLRVIVDTRARTPVSARALHAPGECVVAVGETAPGAAVCALEQAGASVLRLPEKDGRVDLAALIAELGRRDVMSVLAEGGGTLAAGLLAERLVHKLRLFLAPKLLGVGGLPSIGVLPIQTMSETMGLRIARTQSVGDDILITATPCSPD